MVDSTTYVLKLDKYVDVYKYIYLYISENMYMRE